MRRYWSLVDLRGYHFVQGQIRKGDIHARFPRCAVDLDLFIINCLHKDLLRLVHEFFSDEAGLVAARAACVLEDFFRYLVVLIVAECVIAAVFRARVLI